VDPAFADDAGRPPGVMDVATQMKPRLRRQHCITNRPAALVDAVRLHVSNAEWRRMRDEDRASRAGKQQFCGF